MAASPPPIPQRIAPLAWRTPVLLWTPLGLALAIGWPAVLFLGDNALQQAAIGASAAVFAAALAWLGASWALGRAPKARRSVLAHILSAAAIAAFAAPLVLADGKPPFAAALAMTPLALVLGLPIALLSGLVFAWIALTPPRRRPASRPAPTPQFDVQPFR